jgi:hypothetical protein
VSSVPGKAEPLWVRDTMLADYQANARRAGIEPSSRDVEALVLSDLTVAEAVERESKPPAPRAKPEQSMKVSPRLEKLAQETGHTIYRRGLDESSPTVVTPAQVKAKAMQRRRARRMAFLSRPPKHPKEHAMVIRLGRILSIRSVFRPSIEADYTIPDLANRWARLMVDLEKGRGLFDGKHARDCERIYWAEVWDICEKSSGKLGPFWVK